jgi:hypothetical protein
MNEQSYGPADVVTGLMLQITQQAERLALLDQREASHSREIIGRLDGLEHQIAEIAEGADAVRDEPARQAALLETLDELDQQVAGLATRLTQMTARSGPGESNQTDQSTPAPRWWKLDEQGRDEALSRLRAWVEQIYRPCYGHLAAVLGPCWEQHLLCVYGLDWLMELWTALYLTPERKASILASQAGWQTRLLPAIAEQLHYETTHCEHDRLTGETRRGAIQSALNRNSPTR